MDLRAAIVYGSYPATFPSFTKSGAVGPGATAWYNAVNHSSTKTNVAKTATDRSAAFQHFHFVREREQLTNER